MQRASRGREAEGGKRQSQRQRNQKQPHREKGERDMAIEARMAYREREEGRRILPTPRLWRQGEVLGSFSARAQPAGLPERGRDGPHPEAVRVPPGGGRGDGARHEPRLERGSSRILQRLSWQWAGRLHRPGSLVWDFSAGREDRGPAPSVPSVLGSAGGLGGWESQREAHPCLLAGGKQRHQVGKCVAQGHRVSRSSIKAAPLPHSFI